MEISENNKNNVKAAKVIGVWYEISLIASLDDEQGLFLRILWCRQGGDHPETNLANSGYMPDMKVDKN